MTEEKIDYNLYEIYEDGRVYMHTGGNIQLIFERTKSF